MYSLCNQTRFKNKRGRIRAHLNGKRQDFSGRTVISGSNDVDVFEIGIPQWFAEILTVPETVQPHNIHHLTSLLRRGKISFIETEDGSLQVLLFANPLANARAVDEGLYQYRVCYTTIWVARTASFTGWRHCHVWSTGSNTACRLLSYQFHSPLSTVCLLWP